MFPPKVVLAAVDYSDASRVALTVAARLAVLADAKLHVLHAQDPLLDTAARSRGVDLAPEAAEELRRFVSSALADIAGGVALHVITGPAVDVIRDTAGRESADVIVVGATGVSGPERTIFGSTAEGVVRRANTSVFVVRTGSRD